jgi:inosine triphosphate pyrophosphatase
MAGTAAVRVLPKAVTFVTGNAKKLEEVRAILGASIPFHSLKLECESFLLNQLPSFVRSD